jgi:helix-turn-helix protein
VVAIARAGSPYATSKEAAEYLRMSEGHLRNMRVRRLGPPYYKHGSRVLYRLDELTMWVESASVDRDLRVRASGERGDQVVAR